MKVRDDHEFELTRPAFLPEHDQLSRLLQAMSRDELQALYGCSERTLEPVYQALLQEKEGIVPLKTPALLAYDGIAFTYMAPGVFEDAQWTYVQAHVRILSALYGVLRPLDGITPYRLEMAQQIPALGQSLYAFWGDRLASALEDETVINLASKEYSRAVSPYIRLIDVHFYEEDEKGKRREKGVYAKIARGQMVRFLTDRQAEEPDVMKDFDEMGYAYDAASSDANCFNFVRKEDSHGK